MIDLVLMAANEQSMMSKLKAVGKRLTHIDEGATDQFSDASHEHALTTFTPLVVTPGTYDEDGNEIDPPVLNNKFFALLRCSQEIADLVSAIPGDPKFIINEGDPLYDAVNNFRVWA